MVFLEASLPRKGYRSSALGMGIDSMRIGAGKCPFLIVGGLILVCVMLLCNWWALTAENAELLKQIDELSEQLKYSVDERDKCVTSLGEKREDVKKSKTEIGRLHVQLEQQKQDFRKQNEDLDESLTICKSKFEKLEATKKDELESLKLENEDIKSRMEKTKEENRKLKEDYEKIKDELDKLKLSIHPEPPKRPVNVAELMIRQKSTDSPANDVIEKSKTDAFTPKNSKMTDLDNAAEQV